MVTSALVDVRTGCVPVSGKTTRTETRPAARRVYTLCHCRAAAVVREALIDFLAFVRNAIMVAVLIVVVVLTLIVVTMAVVIIIVVVVAVAVVVVVVAVIVIAVVVTVVISVVDATVIVVVSVVVVMIMIINPHVPTRTTILAINIEEKETTHTGKTISQIHTRGTVVAGTTGTFVDTGLTLTPTESGQTHAGIRIDGIHTATAVVTG